MAFPDEMAVFVNKRQRLLCEIDGSQWVKVPELPVGLREIMVASQQIYRVATHVNCGHQCHLDDVPDTGDVPVQHRPSQVALVQTPGERYKIHLFGLDASPPP